MRRPFVAMLALLGLLCASAFGFVPFTPAGVQCPTASVQTVVVRDCCGHLVARAPRPGDHVFVQCRCAEKKAASTQTTVAQKITLFLTGRPSSIVAAAPLPLRAIHTYAAPASEWSVAPALRPPTLT